MIFGEREMPKKICENCGKSVDDYVKFCPGCGGNQFRQLNQVSNSSSSVPTRNSSQNSDLVHKLFYWNYGGRYIFSKTKFISILTFFAFVISGFEGSTGIMIFLGLIFAMIAYVIGFSLHKILGNDKPSVNVLDNNDYGFFEDLKHSFFYWQNKNTGEFVFSKTKSITILIFFVLSIVGYTLSPPYIFACLIFGLVFAIPAGIIGYAIHKLTNNDPKPKEVVAKPKPQVAPKVKEKKVEAPAAPKPVETKSEFKKYQSQLDDLVEEYDSKEKHLRDLIAKRFEPPQLTYDRFIAAVDNCTKIFNEKAESVQSIIDLASDDSKRVDDEIKSRMEILKSLIDKIDDLTDELVLNIGKSDDVDVKDLLVDMEDLIDSVKNYD